jgi:hypothetical protein
MASVNLTKPSLKDGTTTAVDDSMKKSSTAGIG